MTTDSMPVDRADDVFVCRVSVREARRQLRVSVGVVVILSVGIVSAAVTIGAHPLSAKRDVLSTVPLSSVHADTAVQGAKPI